MVIPTLPFLFHHRTSDESPTPVDDSNFRCYLDQRQTINERTNLSELRGDDYLSCFVDKPNLPARVGHHGSQALRKLSSLSKLGSNNESLIAVNVSDLLVQSSYGRQSVRKVLRPPELRWDYEPACTVNKTLIVKLLVAATADDHCRQPLRKRLRRRWKASVIESGGNHHLPPRIDISPFPPNTHCRQTFGK